MPPAPARKRRSAYAARQERFGWAMISPAMLFLFLMATFPLLALIVISFFHVDLSMPYANGWAGLSNYVEMLTDARFWYSLWVTFLYTAVSVFIQIVFGLGLAMSLMGTLKGQAVLRVSLILPMILAPVVVGLAWRTLILAPSYGILDYISIWLGFGTVPWLTSPGWALASVIVMHAWQWTPFAFLVFLASLHALPAEPLEAALLDTKSAWQRFRHIIFPMIRPAVVIVVIIRTMIALRAFAAIISATGGGPGTATEILNLYAYRVSFNMLNLGYGAALGTVLLVLTVVISLIFFRLRRSEM